MTGQPTGDASGPSKTTVFLVDDHRMLREGLRALLQRQPGVTVIGDAGDGESALRAVRSEVPDIVVLDVHLPDLSGVEVARRILAVFPEVRVIMLSSDSSPTRVHEALLAGVSGYVLKENALTELVRAIESVRAGRLYLCPEVGSDVIENYRRGRPPGGPSARPLLSEREVEVLKLIADGLRTKEIADQLKVSPKTVETYRQRLMEKLKVDSVAGLTRYAVREGIIVA